MTVPKFHFITLELLPCDNYRPVTIFWPSPEVVTISDKHCNNLKYLPLAAIENVLFWSNTTGMEWNGVGSKRRGEEGRVGRDSLALLRVSGVLARPLACPPSVCLSRRGGFCSSSCSASSDFGFLRERKILGPRN